MKDLSASQGVHYHDEMRFGVFESGMEAAARDCVNLQTVLAVALNAAGRLQFDFADGSYAAVSAISPGRWFVECGRTGAGQVQ